MWSPPVIVTHWAAQCGKTLCPMRCCPRPVRWRSLPTQSKARPIKSAPRPMQSRARRMKNRARQVESAPRRMKNRARQVESAPRRMKNRARQVKSAPRRMKNRARQVKSAPTREIFGFTLKRRDMAYHVRGVISAENRLGAAGVAWWTWQAIRFLASSNRSPILFFKSDSVFWLRKRRYLALEAP